MSIERKRYEHTVVENESAHIFEDIKATVIDRVHPQIVPHDTAPLLCYVDATLVVETKSGHFLPWKVRGMQAKILKGKPFLGMPAEKSKADGKFYEHYFPLSKATREALTAKVFRDVEVIDCANQLRTMIEAENARVAAGQTAGHDDSLQFGVQPQTDDAPTEAFSADNPFYNAG